VKVFNGTVFSVAFVTRNQQSLVVKKVRPQFFLERTLHAIRTVVRTALLWSSIPVHPNILHPITIQPEHEISFEGPSEMDSNMKVVYQFLPVYTLPAVRMDLATWYCNAHPEGALPVMTFQDIPMAIWQCLRAVRATSKHGIVHRDLKPRNFVVDDQIVDVHGVVMPQIRLLDFDSACLHVHLGGPDLSDTLGSYCYQDPMVLQYHVGRQFYNQGPQTVATFESDVWSIGMMLWRMITGEIKQDHLENLTASASLASIYKLIEIQEHKLDTALHTSAQQHLRAVFAKNNCPEGSDEAAIDLLNRMLALYPRHRITVQEALHHPFFQVHFYGSIHRVRTCLPVPRVSVEHKAAASAAAASAGILPPPHPVHKLNVGISRYAHRQIVLYTVSQLLFQEDAKTVVLTVPPVDSLSMAMYIYDEITRWSTSSSSSSSSSSSADDWSFVDLVHLNPQTVAESLHFCIVCLCHSEISLDLKVPHKFFIDEQYMVPFQRIMRRVVQMHINVSHGSLISRVYKRVDQGVTLSDTQNALLIFLVYICVIDINVCMEHPMEDVVHVCFYLAGVCRSPKGPSGLRSTIVKSMENVVQMLHCSTLQNKVLRPWKRHLQGLSNKVSSGIQSRPFEFPTQVWKAFGCVGHGRNKKRRHMRSLSSEV
jgi:serine/threonine protein kinase